MRYLSDENDLSRQAKVSPGGVVDILEDCGSFDPGSSPGRGVFLFKFLNLKKIVPRFHEQNPLFNTSQKIH